VIVFHRAKPEDTERIRLAAHREGASPVVSTHYIDKDGEIVGALSIGAITQVFAWIGHGLKVRESLQIQAFIEGTVAKRIQETGMPPVYSVLVDKPSRLIKLMPKVGYVPFGDVSLFIKPL